MKVRISSVITSRIGLRKVCLRYELDECPQSGVTRGEIGADVIFEDSSNI